jgi:hypothetical protein
MKNKTITTTSKVWLGNISGPDDLKKPPLEVVNSLTFLNPACSDADWAALGYTRVGDAEITITLVDTNTLVQNKVESLRAEQKQVLAEAQLKSTQLESKIQKLLAIECAPEVA